MRTYEVGEGLKDPVPSSLLYKGLKHIRKKEVLKKNNNNNLLHGGIDCTDCYKVAFIVTLAKLLLRQFIGILVVIK